MTILPPAEARARAIQKAFFASLESSDRRTDPYRHWLLFDVLPEDAAREIVALPIDLPEGRDFSMGRRETNNASRTYFDQTNRGRFAVVRALADVFQAPETVAFIERETSAALAGTNLRIEFCQDVDGFWLEPHTDIGVKRFTMSLYLCEGDGAAELGTDIYRTDKTWFGRAPSPFNSAMIFVPSKETFHGFAAKKIAGVRKSLIINYVTEEWRNRHELAFPDEPVRSAG